MRKKIVGIFVCMLLLTILLPIATPARDSVNPEVKEPIRNTFDIENGSNLTFWICQFSVDGITWISWLPLFGLYVTFNGTIYIKAFQVLNIDTNETGDYFGTYNLTGNFTAIMRHFIFRGSSGPNKMEAFCLNVILFRDW